MVGQERLLNRIPNELDKFPHTLLIEGDKGSGRHTLFNEICKNFSVEPIDFKELGINKQTIDDLLISPSIHFCLVDLTGISIKEQNVMLKFLEEPLNHCYIVLLCESISQVLRTVVNRCQHWKMEPYTKEQLRLFYNEYTMFNEFPYTNEKIFDIATTPGDIIELLNTNNDEVFSLIENIINNIGNANFSNVLILVDKIKEFNEEKGIVNFEVFLKMFLYIIREKIKQDANIKLYEVFRKLQDIYTLHKNAKQLHLNEKQLYENFLLDLKMTLK